MVSPSTAAAQLSANDVHSGIFGYINYLVEKDRRYIIQTIINGESGLHGYVVRPLLATD